MYYRWDTSGHVQKQMAWYNPLKFQKSGISFSVDNKRPNLVNLTEDPQLSETLLYMLKGGTTKVGRMTEKSVHDIKLSGPLIADNHW